MGQNNRHFQRRRGIDCSKQSKNTGETPMEHPEKLLWLIGAAAILLIISFFGKKTEWLINFALRSIMGTIALYFINMGIAALGFTVTVGINIATVLTTGILGLPGIVLLYGLGVYHMVQGAF